jgi:DNA-directed RNA polymerase specialized sigma24 family protein
MRIHVDETPQEVPEELLDGILGAAADDPEAEAARSERSRRLWRCMAGLSEVERTVVYGQYFRESTLREITSLLGLDNPSGARASLIAAQRKLKRCMEQTGVTGGGS